MGQLTITIEQKIGSIDRRTLYWPLLFAGSLTVPFSKGVGGQGGGGGAGFHTSLLQGAGYGHGWGDLAGGGFSLGAGSTTSGRGWGKGWGDASGGGKC